MIKVRIVWDGINWEGQKEFFWELEVFYIFYQCGGYNGVYTDIKFYQSMHLRLQQFIYTISWLHFQREKYAQDGKVRIL